MLLGALILAVAPISNAEAAAVRMAAESLSRQREGARWELQTVVPALRERMAAFDVGGETVIVGEPPPGSLAALGMTSGAQPRDATAQPRNRTTTLAMALALLAAALTAAAAFWRRGQVALLAAAGALVVTSTWSVLQGGDLPPPAKAAASRRSPKEAIQEARAAAAKGDGPGMVLAYERAISLGPGRDGLWLEAANAMMAHGYEERGAGYLQRLARIGSRNADVYYSLAVIAGNAGRNDEAEQWLRQAWALRPVPREQLLGMPAFAPLLRRESFAKLISLGSEQEPLVVSPVASTRPIALPPNARATLSGELLEITIGTRKLAVPGGAALAPRGTPVVRATRTDEKEWKDEAATLIELAEQFAARDQYDQAVKAYDRAQRLRPNGAIDDRVRQIRMNQRLATKYYATKTRHFELRYPPGTGALLITQLGDTLEAQLRQLQEWIPVAELEPVTVNVVPWDEFRGTYTQSDRILGFYNRGRITVPLAGAPELSPEAIAILRHELAHAMIAQATNDRAPRWFHEGLAQLVEPRPVQANGWKVELPVTLLDVVLRRSNDPEMIAAAYDTALRDVAQYDRAGVHRMLRSFREGVAP